MKSELVIIFLTVHRSKGLESDNVIVMGMNNVYLLTCQGKNSIFIKQLVIDHKIIMSQYFNGSDENIAVIIDYTSKKDITISSKNKPILQPYKNSLHHREINNQVEIGRHNNLGDNKTRVSSIIKQSKTKKYQII